MEPVAPREHVQREALDLLRQGCDRARAAKEPGQFVGWKDGGEEGLEAAVEDVGGDGEADGAAEEAALIEGAGGGCWAFIRFS